MEEKPKRQQALVKLLESKAFSNQGDVVQAMKSAGFEVTQPSISRDFNELGIVKLAGRYVASNQIMENARVGELADMVAKIEAVGPHLVVVKTNVGAANLVAAAIDDLALDGLAGTVAGDDTVFIATKNSVAQRRVIHSIVQLRH